MSTPTFQYPAVVSRTLSPNSKSLVTVVAMHDRQITDADINLLQDLQSYKSENLVKDHGVTSGGTTYAPFQYATSNPNTFFIPSFDVLFNNEIVSIVGQQSPDLTLNRIQTPVPAPLVPGNEDARLFIVFLELWYRALNPITGAGYYQDPLNPGPKYFYPYGGILPDPSNAKILPDDSVDPFQGLFTTERAQIQWRLNIQRVALDYDFTQETFGFYYPNARVPGTGYGNITAANDPGQIIYGQAALPTAVLGVSPLIGLPTYQFTNMGGVNGDTGLWRCGDGNINNSLGTMDGYSYAMPVAVLFQRNTGNFDIVNNIYGCASSMSSVQNTGTLATSISGRYDSKLADQIFQSEVVDTRTTTSLTGIDMDDLMRKGFVDLITGKTNLAISRFGAAQGNKTEAVGSLLDYYIAVNSAQVGIPQTIGAFDGFTNGFSSDLRTFFSTQQITVNNKTTGISGLPWTVGDSFAISLPQTSRATITTADVTVLVLNPVTGAKSPAALLQGQVQISGLNSLTVTVTFTNNLTGTAFDPGSQNIYVTVGVTYPAGGSTTTVVIPDAIQGGVIVDTSSGRTLPVYGVSEYEVQSQQIALNAFKVWAINPEYSNIVLGTKIWKTYPGNTGTVSTLNGASITTFVFSVKGLDENLNGLYVTRAWDFATGNFYNVASRTMQSLPNNGGIQHTIVLDGAVQPSSTVVFSFLAQDTVQLAYNAPVKGVTQIEETVLFGNYTADSNFPMDSRVVIESVTYAASNDTNTIVLGANGCEIKGISGDDTVPLIWGFANGVLTAYSVSSATIGAGTIIVTVPGLGGTIVFAGPMAQPFVIAGSILPAFTPASTLTLQVQYVPYQGEGIVNRAYDILHSEDNALITTNGTGAAPVIGLSDVFPYNRELPIITTLPAQLSWNDAGLTNSPIASVFDSNYVAMQQDNVEHTFLVPMHTNDFIPPVNKDTRKQVQFIAAGARGFSQAIPHIGYAIEAPTPRTVLGQNLQSTTAPITLYVNNSSGSDNNTGLTAATAKLTIGSALSELPPVLRDPCTIILVYTGVPFSISALQNNLQVIALGDGDIRSAKQYALGNLSRVIQNEGRLVISSDPSSTNPSIIDATGFSGFGDGPTAAFYIDTSRVILSGIQFQGFTNPAIVAYNSDIDFVDCIWTNNVQAGSYIGCDSVILDGGSTSMPSSGTGHVLVQCNFTSSNHNLVLPAGSTPQGAFYVGTRNSTMTLTQHNTGSLDETNIAASAVVASAQLNSSISTDSTFQTSGNAVLVANSVLLRTVTVNPFVGGVVADSSSFIVTQVG